MEILYLLIGALGGAIIGAYIYHSGVKTGSKVQHHAGKGFDPFEEIEEFDQTHTYEIEELD